MAASGSPTGRAQAHSYRMYGPGPAQPVQHSSSSSHPHGASPQHHAQFGYKVGRGGAGAAFYGQPYAGASSAAAGGYVAPVGEGGGGRSHAYGGHRGAGLTGGSGAGGYYGGGGAAAAAGGRSRYYRW